MIPMRSSVFTARLRSMLVVMLTMTVTAPAPAADKLVLSIQPILDPAQTRAAFAPLADYLGKAAGIPCEIRSYDNFLTYWKDTYQGKYDLVLDAAHFTDYRVRKLKFEVLAKVPDQVSYTLVSRSDRLVIDPLELVGKRVATLGPPSLGAARLATLYPRSTRQPIVVETNSSDAALDMVIDGSVHAAIVPTPLVAQRMSTNAPLSVVTETVQVPHIAVSAAPTVDPSLRNRIRDALLNADKTDAGRKMLEDIGFLRFDPANAKIYDGQADILQSTWGY